MPIRILLVDDDPDILQVLKDNLELDGYTVITAGAGKTGIDLCTREAVDLVVLDLMLPDMDGIQVCRALRSRSAVPIIMLTAKDSLTDKVLGLESGADDYLAKPFDYLELAARIKACLRRMPSAVVEEDVLVGGGVRLETGRRSAMVGGSPVSLTKKEFDLLALLMENPDQAMDRETIRNVLWPDRQIYAWSRTIDVHIQHLRAKIESDPARPRHIVTVQGVGYMFQQPPMP
jgi:DNA-binding response OmpR family regulator